MVLARVPKDRLRDRAAYEFFRQVAADGRTLHLVFSGDDCFSVRRLTLTLRPEGVRIGSR
jgi:hypothetical protein